MIKSARLCATLLVLAALLTGCGPSPDAVCKHVATLDEKSGKDCPFKMQMMHDTKREQYNKLAPCIMEAKDAAAYNKCLADHQK
jgi:hypothetical protein